MATYPITPKVLEILASRICHDLISPVAAVNNGVEFFEEMGAEAGDDAIGLIAHSASQASARLQLFRFAYAAGGSEKHVSLDDVRTTFENYIQGGRTELEWSIQPNAMDGILPAGFAKVFLHSMMVALDVLPKGGKILVSADGNDEDSATATVLVQSEHIMPTIEYTDALEGKANSETLTPKTVHPYLTRAFAEKFGITLDIEPSETEIRFTIKKG